MKLNKTLASALLLSVALTGCNNMVENENAETKEENAPVVEENTTETENEAKDTAETTDAETKDEDAAKTEENADEETPTNTANLSTEEKIEALEQAVFDNRSSARAVELLFELSPETANENADVLNELLENSNTLLDQAQTALDELKAE